MESKSQNLFIDDVDQSEYLSDLSDFRDNLNDNIEDIWAVNDCAPISTSAALNKDYSNAA